jgi:hypothetical protein
MVLKAQAEGKGGTARLLHSIRFTLARPDSQGHARGGEMPRHDCLGKDLLGDLDGERFFS